MDCRLGVLALGDSITNGGGELQWGVALQSWALWLARGLGLPFTTYAVDGARAADVAGAQVAAFGARAAHPEARYDVGCLYAGVNDVRAVDWDPAGFERDLRTALAFLAARCDRVLACTIPLDLGRPRAGARVVDANARIRRAAADHRALVVGLEDFGARNRVMVDAVHPTAFGQVELAERALDVLAADGLPARVRPHELIAFETTRWRRLRGDFTYAYRHAKQAARIAAGAARARRASARALRPERRRAA
jgi:lysophospholipase L1-like esterase